MNSTEYVILPVEVLESLKDFDTWKDFKNDSDFLKDKDIQIIKKSKLKISVDSCPWDNYSGTHF
jgi:hypothetical protein